ncbi:MAG: sulfatase [Acidimicrobiales bacterium]|nr:MAG: sulfatase [Acidimicrobiales bacterium]
MPPTAPPNIVFAFADDWGRYASAYRGYEGTSAWNEVIDTPNFDGIAAEGALFLNALVPAPTCTPCRSSILAGRYFWQTGLGSILMGSEWDDEIPTFPLELEERGGYEIGHTYKVWSPGQTRNAPMGGLRTSYNPAGLDFNQFSHFVTAFGEKYGITAAKELMYTETRDNVRSFLLARRKDRPFCYWWGPANTHRSWERGSGKALWDLDPDDLEGRMPGFLPDVPEVREDVADYLGEVLAFDEGLGILVEELKKAGEYDNTIIVVSGDHGIPGIPRSKNNLYDIGCEVALAVRWPGVVEPGRVIDDFVNIMDFGPTLCEAGGIEPPADMSATSLMSLLQSPASGQVEAERDFVVTGRERHVAQARAGFLPYPQRSLREKDFIYIINFEPDRWPMGDPVDLGPDTAEEDKPTWDQLASNPLRTLMDWDGGPTKAWMILNREDQDVEPLYDLAVGKRPREELYDLQADPDYLVNLAADPAHEETRARMEARLLSVLEEHNDPRLMEQPCRYELEPYAGPPDTNWFAYMWFQK